MASEIGLRQHRSNLKNRLSSFLAASMAKSLLEVWADIHIIDLWIYQFWYTRQYSGRVDKDSQ